MDFPGRCCCAAWEGPQPPSVPFSQSPPPSLRRLEAGFSLHQGKDPGQREACFHRGRGRASTGITPLATPHASAVLTSLQCPSQGDVLSHRPRPGPRASCLTEDLHFKQFFKLFYRKRCDQNSISKLSVFLCTGVILINSSFILIFVQPTETSFSNVFHSQPPQKQKYYL